MGYCMVSASAGRRIRAAALADGGRSTRGTRGTQTLQNVVHSHVAISFSFGPLPHLVTSSVFLFSLALFVCITVSMSPPLFLSLSLYVSLSGWSRCFLMTEWTATSRCGGELPPRSYSTRNPNQPPLPASQLANLLKCSLLSKLARHVPP